MTDFGQVQPVAVQKIFGFRFSVIESRVCSAHAAALRARFGELGSLHAKLVGSRTRRRTKRRRSREQSFGRRSRVARPQPIRQSRSLRGGGLG